MGGLGSHGVNEPSVRPSVSPPHLGQTKAVVYVRIQESLDHCTALDCFDNKKLYTRSKSGMQSSAP